MTPFPPARSFPKLSRGVATASLLSFAVTIAGAGGTSGSGRQDRAPAASDLVADVAMLAGPGPLADAAADRLTAAGAAAVPLLQRACAVPNSLRGNVAAWVLGRIGAPAVGALPALQAALPRADAISSTQYLWAIGELALHLPDAERAKVDAALRPLASQPAGFEARLARAKLVLGRKPEARAVAKTLRIESDRSLRIAALRCVARGDVAVERGVPAAAAAAADEAALTRTALAEAFERAIVTWHRSGDAFDRREVLAAAEALAPNAPDDRSAARVYAALLSHGDHRVRSSSAQALVELAPRFAREVRRDLTIALHDGSPQVQRHAAAALGALGVDAGMGMARLRQLAEGPQGNGQTPAELAAVRAAAGTALTAIERAVRAREEARRNDAPAYEAALDRVLHAPANAPVPFAAGSESAQRCLRERLQEAWLVHRDEQRVQRLCRVIVNLGAAARPLLPDVLELVQEADARVACAALRALAALDTRVWRNEGKLLAQLEHAVWVRDGDLGLAAAFGRCRAAAALGADSSLAELLDALAANDPCYRLRAAELLRALGRAGVAAAEARRPETAGRCTEQLAAAMRAVHPEAILVSPDGGAIAGSAGRVRVLRAALGVAIRTAAAQALLAIAPAHEARVEALFVLCESDDARAQRQAVVALRDHPEVAHRAIPRLHAVLAYEPRQMVLEIVTTIGVLGRAATEAAAGAGRDTAAAARRAVADVEPTLERLAGGEDRELALRAQAALRLLRGDRGTASDGDGDRDGHGNGRGAGGKNR